MKPDNPADPQTQTTQTDTGPALDDAARDVDSDPAKGADDWSDEGGATPSGPAGDTDA